MLRNILLTATLAAYFLFQTASVQAMAGKLRKPGIAIPSDSKSEQIDPTAAAINKVLGTHEKQFVDGHFINAHTALHFNGGTKTINALLDELSQIDGAVLRIRFWKEFDLVAPSSVKIKTQPKICDCVIDHNAWADAHAVTITICPGGEVILGDLVFPTIRGTRKPE